MQRTDAKENRDEFDEGIHVLMSITHSMNEALNKRVDKGAFMGQDSAVIYAFDRAEPGRYEQGAAVDFASGSSMSYALLYSPATEPASRAHFWLWMGRGYRC